MPGGGERASRADVCHLLDEMVRALSGPLPRSERKAGWDEENRVAWLEYFQALRRRLEDDRPLTDEETRINVAREMDFSGISGGDLTELGASISLELKALKGK